MAKKSGLHDGDLKNKQNEYKKKAIQFFQVAK
jgi:hypothetical protein